MIDGVTLVDDTLSVLRGGAVAIAPLLIGANTDDANLFVAGVPAYANMSAAVYAAHIYASLHMGGRTQHQDAFSTCSPHSHPRPIPRSTCGASRPSPLTSGLFVRRARPPLR